MELTLVRPDSGPENFLSDIYNRIQVEDYVADISTLITSIVSTIASMHYCSLWLMEAPGAHRKIHLKASARIPIELFSQTRLHLEEGVVGYVASHQKTLIIRNVRQHSRFIEKQMAEKLNLVSMISVPMISDQETTLGILNGYTKYEHDFSQSEIRKIERIANQAAALIQRVQSIAADEPIKEAREINSLLNQAAQLLCRRCNIRTEEAVSWMKKHSRIHGKTLRQIAEAILLSSDRNTEYI